MWLANFATRKKLGAIFSIGAKLKKLNMNWLTIDKSIIVNIKQQLLSSSCECEMFHNSKALSIILLSVLKSSTYTTKELAVAW